MVSISDLQKIGFSKNQAKVYLALFNIGKGKASEVIKETGLHRHLVYTALESLVSKKLIAQTEVRGVKHFAMLDPERLLQTIQIQETLAQQYVSTAICRRIACSPHATLPRNCCV